MMVDLIKRGVTISFTCVLLKPIEVQYLINITNRNLVYIFYFIDIFLMRFVYDERQLHLQQVYPYTFMHKWED